MKAYLCTRSFFKAMTMAQEEADIARVDHAVMFNKEHGVFVVFQHSDAAVDAAVEALDMEPGHLQVPPSACCADHAP